MDPCKNGKNSSIRPYSMKCIVAQPEFGRGRGSAARQSHPSRPAGGLVLDQPRGPSQHAISVELGESHELRNLADHQ
jgi:hypothetical protein